MLNRQTKRWNIFARELEDILVARGLRLTQLDDRTAIHREKVRRLVRSLLTPKSFPVLNPSEMDEIIVAFNLTEDEVLRLRAAILTTAVEAMLMDRIYRDDALAVAEQVLPMIFQAMRRGALRAVRGDVKEMDEEIEQTEIDVLLESTLDLIDRATMSMHLYQNVGIYSESVKLARQALDDFNSALTELESVGKEIQVTETWKVWQKETQKGIDIVTEYLEELGM